MQGKTISGDHLSGIKIRIQRAGLDALVVDSLTDIRYLTGRALPGGRMLIPVKGRPVYLIDPMNESYVRDILREVPTVDIFRVSPGNSLGKLIRDKGLNRLGVNEKSLSMVEYKGLAGLQGTLTIKDSAAITEALREIKTGHEISLLKKAAKKTVKIWRQVKKNISRGMTEKEIASTVDILIREQGCSNSFPTIAASGVNTAYPHAFPGRRKVKDREHVLLDFGIRCEDYCSDLTRIWYNGRIDRQIRGFLKHVRKAHDLAIKRIRPGVVIGGVAEAANNVMIKAGLGEFILHGLGHGIGLDIHESPFFGVKARGRFKKNMVVTVEPGLYRQGLGGVRIEDMVLVTKNGCEVLTA